MLDLRLLTQGVTSMVRAGLGVAVMPLLAVWGQRDDEALSFHPLEPAVPDRVVHLVWRGTLSPLAGRLRDVAVDAGRRLVSELTLAQAASRPRP
ncbi:MULTISPECIES: LysR substrate-binding domain-containing protein [unclassified Knoellia]|uniref:LysR substrate-binding domain-containing protein n=1 Tax=Knoellia altitudinis TaxID=3404795 RepID=UPI003622D657